MLLLTFFHSMIALSAIAAGQTQLGRESAADFARTATLRNIEQIKRADYEGDRAALKGLHDQLKPPADNKIVASRIEYWRGFALWRRAINGFNETPTPTDLQDDLNAAIADFKESLVQDSGYVESKIAEASCLGYLMYLDRRDPTRVQELSQQSSLLLKNAMETDPDNPRLLWVLGPIRWSTPPERGGGQEKAFDLYNRGLESFRKQPAPNDPLEPHWGEPELLMNRSWSYLNAKTPDFKAAQRDAEATLELVPCWHYVRDILMRQIRDAQIKAKVDPRR